MQRKKVILLLLLCLVGSQYAAGQSPSSQVKQAGLKNDTGRYMDTLRRLPEVELGQLQEPEYLLQAGCRLAALSFGDTEVEAIRRQLRANDSLQVSADLAEEPAELLRQKLKALKELRNIEMKMVLAGGVGQKELKPLTTKLFNRWGIGNAEQNNGVLLVLSLNQDRVEIETGYGVEQCLTDLECKTIIEQELIPHLKAGHLSLGLLRAIDQVAAKSSDCRFGQAGEEEKASLSTAYFYGGFLLWLLLWWYIFLLNEYQLKNAYQKLKQNHNIAKPKKLSKEAKQVMGLGLDKIPDQVFSDINKYRLLKTRRETAASGILVGGGIFGLLGGFFSFMALYNATDAGWWLYVLGGLAVLAPFVCGVFFLRKTRHFLEELRLGPLSKRSDGEEFVEVDYDDAQDRVPEYIRAQVAAKRMEKPDVFVRQSALDQGLGGPAHVLVHVLKYRRGPDYLCPECGTLMLKTLRPKGKRKRSKLYWGIYYRTFLMECRYCKAELALERYLSPEGTFAGGGAAIGGAGAAAAGAGGAGGGAGGGGASGGGGAGGGA